MQFGTTISSTPHFPSVCAAAVHSVARCASVSVRGFCGRWPRCSSGWQVSAVVQAGFPLRAQRIERTDLVPRVAHPLNKQTTFCVLSLIWEGIRGPNWGSSMHSCRACCCVLPWRVNRSVVDPPLTPGCFASGAATRDALPACIPSDSSQSSSATNCSAAAAAAATGAFEAAEAPPLRRRGGAVDLPRPLDGACGHARASLDALRRMSQELLRVVTGLGLAPAAAAPQQQQRHGSAAAAATAPPAVLAAPAAAEEAPAAAVRPAPPRFGAFDDSTGNQQIMDSFVLSSNGLGGTP